MQLNYLDGFSGYGGFHKGLEQAGIEFDNVYYSEIDKYAIANYSYNYPNSIYAGSITDISRGTIPNLDLFSFGWPCQDNSIAGKRKGQTGGTRSGLLRHAVRVIDIFKPRLFIAENVTGLLSVNKGIDIIESLKLLTYLNDSCPQYDIEMQLLNTRWFLPQNRERLFFVGHLRNGGGRKIFPIGESEVLYNKSDTAGKSPYSIASCLNAKGQSNWTGSFIIDLKRSARANQAGLAKTNIRQLTPIECERLQGLPDQWTKHGVFDGMVKEISDTQRYKLCGNGVSVPVIEMIGRKLIHAYNL